VSQRWLADGAGPSMDAMGNYPMQPKNTSRSGNALEETGMVYGMHPSCLLSSEALRLQRAVFRRRVISAAPLRHRLPHSFLTNVQISSRKRALWVT